MADFTVSSDIDTFMQSADKAAMRTNMDLGTAATKDVAATGDAASGEVVKGDDTRLTDARTPTSHTHTASEITDFDTEVANNTTVAANTSKLAGIEAGAEVNNISDTNATDLTDGGDSTLHYHSADRSRANHTGTQTLSTISDAGTAASKDFPAAGDAAAGEVVLGNDSRLTDARTPVSHTHTASEITDFDTEVSNNTTVAANTSKLAGIEAGAEVNNISDTNATDLTDGGDSTLHYHSADRNRANHTGTQTLSTISDAGTIASQNSNSVTITGGSITGITDLAVADGGTGAGTAAGARTNLEVYSDAEVDAKVANKAVAGGVQFVLNSGTIQHAPCLPTTHFTDSAWFYVTPSTASVSTGWLLGDGNTSSDKKIILATFTNTFRLLASTDGTNWTTNVNTNVQIPVDRWFHLSIVYTPSTSIELFIDGVSVYNNTTSIPASLHNSATGMVQNALLYAFRDQLKVRYRRVFNRALSASEVADLYESGTVAVADRWGRNNTWNTPINSSALPVDTFSATSNSFSASTSIDGRVVVEVPNNGWTIGETVTLVADVTSLTGSVQIAGATLLAGNAGGLTTSTFITSTGLQSFSMDVTGNAVALLFLLQSGEAIDLTIKAIKIGGCIADLPLDEGIGYQFHDRSSNHYDALASTTGVTHLVPKTEGYIRDFNVDAYNGGSGNTELVSSSRAIIPDKGMLTRLLLLNNTNTAVGGTFDLKRTLGGSSPSTMQTFNAYMGGIAERYFNSFPVTEAPVSNGGDNARRNIAVTSSDADATDLDIRVDYKIIE